MIRGGTRIRVPGDKSVSHRAVLFGSIAKGTTRVRGLLDAEDVGRTVGAARSLGAAVQNVGRELWVTGAPWLDAGEIDCGNSGTTARLLLGALAPRAGATLHGDDSLSRRPMMRVIRPLRQMGADIEGGPTLPVAVRTAELHGIDYAAEVASAQVKSAVLLAGLCAHGVTRYTEPVPTRDHTERMLRGMGANLRVGGGTIAVEAGALSAADITVPGDISSAAFWMVAAAIHPGASLVLEGVGLNPTRTGVIHVLRRMGARIDVEDHGGIEPIGTVTVTGDGLRGTEIAGAEVPTLIDELPVLAVAAAFAEGQTVVRDAAELRVKESDRVAAVVDGLRAVGAEADPRPDGLVVHGGSPRGGHVDTRGDHRIAMCFSILGLRAPVTVSETDSIRTSYPEFLATLERVRA
ncbi:MAG: 3-phosphoshikimate 1-carboxyvinyltransferase [Deltaproteobacteria bacterium]|nr:3-phosphoshikimate 1-carboxyvinyltransferase [Deltaproteobacteria bacterium]